MATAVPVNQIIELNRQLGEQLVSYRDAAIDWQTKEHAASAAEKAADALRAEVLRTASDLAMMFQNIGAVQSTDPKAAAAATAVVETSNQDTGTGE
jgi:hypothetical protein